METGLKGKVVLVTGASGGLGSVMVKTFAAEGARVVIHYHNHRDAAETLAETIESADRAVIGADLTREEDVARLFRESEQQLGPVEILVANAGVWVADSAPIHQMTLEQWNQTIATDLTAAFLCMREFFRGIERHQFSDPAAVLIGSTAAVFGEAGHADYAAAKGGLVYGFLLSLKNEIARLSRRGRVNAVCPGWTASPMIDRFAGKEEQVRQALQTIPLRKVGRPEDVAAAVMFLASSRLSGHMTGQMLMTSGGMEGRILYQGAEIELPKSE